MIETLTLNAGFLQKQVKSIVRVQDVSDIHTPHRCKYKPGKTSLTIDTDVQINHYWSRDENFFYNVKVNRKKKWLEVKRVLS